MNIKEEVSNIIKTYIGKYVLHEDVELIELGVDDLQFIEIILDIEDKFGGYWYDLSFDLETQATYERLNTVNKATAYIETLIIKYLEAALGDLNNGFIIDYFEDSNGFIDFLQLSLKSNLQGVEYKTKNAQDAIDFLERFLIEAKK